MRLKNAIVSVAETACPRPPFPVRPSAFLRRVVLKHLCNYAVTQRGGWLDAPSHPTRRWNEMESLLWKGFNHNTAEQNCRLENLCRQVSETKTGNPLASLAQNTSWRTQPGSKERRRGVTAKLRILF